MKDETTSMMRKAWNYSRKHPKASFSDFLSVIANENNISESVQRVIDAWNKNKNLISIRKVNDNVTKPIVKFLADYTEAEAIEAIEHYSEMLDNKGYYFDYKWDIRKFFRQSNAAPDFTSEGTKWLNFKSSVKKTDNKVGSIENASEGKIAHFNRRVDQKITDLKTIATTKLKGQENVQIRVMSVLAQAYPIIYSHIANEENLIITHPVKNKFSDKMFLPKWDNVLIMREAGHVIETLNIKNEYSKLF